MCQLFSKLQNDVFNAQLNWIECVLKLSLTHLRLFNGSSSFVGGGRPQTIAGWVEPQSFLK